MVVFRLFESLLESPLIIPDMMILGTVLFCLVYLWIREIKDRHVLADANIRLLQKQDQLKQANINTITSLVLSEETKDPYTHGHSERVKEYSVKIAERLGLPRADIEILERACLLHDLGKIGISDLILHKKEKLNHEEWEQIKKHPEKGTSILEPLEFLPQERLIILHHHEHYDGSGYPSGLKKGEIPLGARILAVADAYDAMNSKRPYRDSLPKERIIEEISQSSGSQFDPKVANVMLNLIKEGFI
jgi:putative nucleotidyltransferase with HDIG domain